MTILKNSILNLKVESRGHLGKSFWCMGFFLFTVLPYSLQHSTSIFLSALSLLPLGLLLPKKNLKFFSWAFALGAGFFVYHQYGHLRGLEPGLSLMLYFTALKTWELKKERDFYIMLLISMLLLVGHLLNLYSLMGLFHLLLSSFFMLLLMMMCHGQESWQWPNRRKMRSLFFMYLIAIPQAVFLFIFFPRFYVGHFNFSSSQMKSKLGFTEKLRPGEMSEVVNDTYPIFRVNFLSEKRPRGQDLYWRGAALLETDGFNWDKGDYSEVKKEPREDDDMLKTSPEVISYQINFAAQERGVGFTLSNTFDVELLGRGRVSLFESEIYRLTPFSNSKMRYLAWSHELRAESELPIEMREKYLQLPENISPRFKRYVLEKFALLPDDSAKARAFMRYFRQENFFYTLRPEPYLGENALEQFFFDKKRGFCEHYSSVTGIAFRILGIPTRVITGFQGGLYNVYGDYFVIRGEDAHAWIEAYIEGKGWQRFDPVEHIAPHRIEFGARDYYLSLLKPEDMSFQNFLDTQDHSFDRELLMRFDAYYFAINQAFISFDYDAQLSVFKKWGLPDWRPQTYLIISLAGGGILGLLFLPYLIGLKRQKKTELQKVFAVFLKRLNRLGFIRPSWMTLEKFAVLVLQHDKWTYEQKESLSKIFQTYLELSFKPIDESFDSQLKFMKISIKNLDLEE